MKHQDALDQLARETSRARQRLALERALRAGLVLLLAVGVWALFALVGVHERLPILLQSLSAIAALAGLIWLGLRARREWQAPTEDEARTRLAADSRLDAGAFEALRDRPARYDAFSMALWAREREHAIARAEHAKAGPPRARLDELDPYKLRFVLAAALLGALVFAGGDAPDRLARAFLPDPGPLLGDQEMAIEAWVTPAEYTHAGPISLSDVVGERVATPPTVEATVRVTGPVGAPVLVFEGRGGRRAVRFERAADGAWQAQLALPGAGRLKIVRFHTRAHWRIAPAPDARPTASFSAPITTLTDETVSLAWRAADDFGVRRLVLRVRPLHPPEGLAHADPVDTPLESPAGDPREAEAENEVDLGAHPYAGMEVEARIVAIDALGQEGVSDPLRFTLPEKIFLQPLAQAAIEIRRHILAERRAYRPARRAERRTIPAGDIVLGNQRIEIRDYERRPNLRRAPEGIRRATRLLDALTMSPEDGYFRDLAVFLGFRTARSQLTVARTIEETDIAADTLWRTALRAEYGGAADARRALEEIQRQLAEALAAGAPQERINQLLEALRRATDNYMQALVQEALRNGERENMEDTEDQTSISEQDIEELLQQVQELNEQGRNAEAQQLLQMLAGILANMEVQLGEQQSGGEGEQDQQMQQSMDELSEAMGEQRQLRDETQQQQQDGGGGSGGEQQGGQGGDDLAQRQAEIRQSLEAAQNMAEQSGAAPSEDLNAAGEAMRRAQDALQQGDFEGAEAAQTAALDRLREGADALAAEMRARGQQGNEQGQGESGRDPLGRATGAGNGDGEGSVPDTADPVRAREIFDEIRRRAQDPNRPEAEREYLRRLMDRFGDS
ncbi:DUF4175 domain-containing protein [Terricaulis silvestris]|uniref:ATPase involved in DNA repair n=1 Tax=Terricaulis silvestris TaxID=2686094 RepID=A0A6I6MU71_9CAUL|nr:DUF4175 family protein [Terricaulis silvestris]QGZ96044.1 hypothetical protein DSM104635_02900 [Terricaulis silvestris]